jgi:hypothetical protein
MTRRNKLIKNQKPCRVTYTPLANRCPICMELHNKSKKYGTPYHLLYHLNDHNTDDEISTKILITDIRSTIKQICKAIEWKMLII